MLSLAMNSSNLYGVNLGGFHLWSPLTPLNTHADGHQMLLFFGCSFLIKLNNIFSLIINRYKTI